MDFVLRKSGFFFCFLKKNLHFLIVFKLIKYNSMWMVGGGCGCLLSFGPSHNDTVKEIFSIRFDI